MTEKLYSELIKIENFVDRYKYLKIGGAVGAMTFGSDRYLNQIFYNSKEWQDFRHKIIIRDEGCDLAHQEHEITHKILIHHLNPITKEDILNRTSKLFDPENVVCVSLRTHNAIHYGDDSILEVYNLTIRKPNDTIPWKGVNNG